MFHILPKLQAKRADFLTVMLTGSLHQRRAFIDTPPETQDDGPKDDDVTKSESDSGASEKSTEQSQDGAPSTLLADDPQKGPKEAGSVADVDPDQEDISKTLVLFSPGDMRKSPNSGEVAETYQAAATTEAPQTEKPVVESQAAEFNQPVQESTESQNKTVDEMVPNVVKQKCTPPVSLPVATASAASPPFTKVERTFIHIAETSHLNVMSSNGPQVQESIPEVSTPVEDGPREFESQKCMNKVVTPSETEGQAGVQSEISSQTPTEEPQVLTVLDGTVPVPICTREDVPIPPISLEMQEAAQNDLSSKRSQNASPEQPEVHKEKLQQGTSEDDTGTKTKVLKSVSPRPRSRSRIPILVSEEDPGLDQSLSTRMLKKVKQQDLARLVVERQRQGRWIRLNSRTSSSLSSGDEPQRASETLSTTGSEEDTHQSDESLNKAKKEAGEQGRDGWRSRIPRPVTPIKRPSANLVVAIPSPLSLPGTSMMKTTQTASNGPRGLQSGTGLHARSKSTLSHSTQPGGSPRMPLRCIFTTSRRSLSTAQCTFTSGRTASPSPQRPGLRTAVMNPQRAPLTVCTTPALSVKSRTTPVPKTHTVTNSRNRTKAPASTKTAAKAKKSTTDLTAAAR